MIIKLSPHRRVLDNVIISNGLPSIRLRVAPELVYLGELKFTLMDVSRVELFLFAQAERDNLQRILTVQFEGYLPDNTYCYEYPQMPTVRLGEHDYLTDGGVLRLDSVLKRRPEGDIAYWVSWLRAKGFRYPQWNELVYRRFVRLLDKANRNELLILYFENLKPTGYNADYLLSEHTNPDIRAGLIDQTYHNALNTIKVIQG